MASPIDYRGSKPIDSQKKKPNIENQKSNPWSRHWQRKPNPNTVYTIYKAKAKQTNTEGRGVYQQKNK